MKPEPVRPDAGSRRYRWVGLVAAVFVYVVAVFTFGLGLLLAPASLAVSVLALRRLPPPRGVMPWVGLAGT